MVIDRLLYLTLGLALAGVVLLDPTFSDNLFRAFGEPIESLSLNPWVASVSFLFLVLAIVALYRERKR